MQKQSFQVNAKKVAEKRFAAKLQSHGLNEDVLQTRSSRTVSEHESYDSYEDDFDDTYLKTKEVEAESWKQNCFYSCQHLKNRLRTRHIQLMYYAYYYADKWVKKNEWENMLLWMETIKEFLLSKVLTLYSNTWLEVWYSSDSSSQGMHILCWWSWVVYNEILPMINSIFSCLVVFCKSYILVDLDESFWLLSAKICLLTTPCSK